MKSYLTSHNTAVSRHSPGGDQVYNYFKVIGIDEAEGVAIAWRTSVNRGNVMVQPKLEYVVITEK